MIDVRARQCPILVGREEERSVLDRALAEVVAGGQPMVALVSGEAGVGKSRLVHEATRAALEQGVSVLTGRCVALGDVVRPAAAVRDIVVELFERTAPDVLAGGLDGAVDVLTRLLPERSLDASAPMGPVPVADVLAGVIRRLARDRPVMIVVDDLHWADPTTLHVVDVLARARWLGRVLIVVTYRSDEVHVRHPLTPVIDDIVRSARPVRLELERLGRDAVSELCSGLLGHPVDAAEVDDLVRRTGGNPFLVEELLQAGGTGESSVASVPATLRDALLATADAFGDDATTCAAVLALAGSLPRDVLTSASAAVCGIEAAAADHVIGSLAATGMVVVDRDTVSFRHELAREVFVELAHDRAADLHVAIARSLAGHPEASPGLLARHWLGAGDEPRALVASVDAGRDAVRIGAAAEALDHFTRAIELWSRVADAGDLTRTDEAGLVLEASVAALHAGRDQSALDLGVQALTLLHDGEPEREVDVLMHLRTLYRYLHRWVDCARVVDRALAIIPPTPPSAVRALALAYAALDRYYAGDAGTSQALADAALEAADTADDLDAIVIARSIAALPGDVSFALETVELCDHGVRPETTLRALNSLAKAYVEADRFADQLAVGERGLQFARTSNLLGPQARAMLTFCLWPAFITGQWDLVEDATDREADFVSDEAAVFRDLVRWRRGKLDDSAVVVDRLLDELDRGVWNESLGLLGAIIVELSEVDQTVDVVGFVDDLHRRQRSAPANEVWEPIATAIGLLADRVAHHHAHERETRLTSYSAAADRWIEYADAIQPRHWTSFTQHVLWRERAAAELERLHHRHDPGRWVEIAEGHRLIAVPWDEATARVRAAEAWLATSDGRSAAARRQVRAQLVRAAAIADGLGAGRLRERIDELVVRARLGNVESHSDTAITQAAPVDDPFGLTEREREILTLVARGRSNGQIGTELYISVKTASVHVSNILRKLSVSNRVEAAAVAHRLGVTGAEVPINRAARGHVGGPTR